MEEQEIGTEMVIFSKAGECVCVLKTSVLKVISNQSSVGYQCQFNENFTFISFYEFL